MILPRIACVVFIATTFAATTVSAQSMEAVPFTCNDGRSLVAEFGQDSVRVTMEVTLEAQPSGSGFVYSGTPGTLRGQGDEVRWQSTGTDPVICTAVPGGAALVGGVWELVQVGEAEIEETGHHTIGFLADGGLVLRADCNLGRGTWEAEPETNSAGALSVGPVALTRMACAADPVPQMAADLSQATSYRVEERTLRIETRAGVTYSFSVQAE
ncbi:conserved hypothetical protein [Dinoroseobacter shibae DFL 12 = DSM 16493]|jgi:heat shock protein HslJ|uniref:DUF306 domain-containing protein n=1 Tax=Dinoroseobacter shibae (strain DSM 16493 / NCIMB 14021 / DFL 12) TaxID=398580 RepID=A8LRA4_DINSH|nr:META domain-containing protein [Dinoroseobacter shibae]ABV94027.1 conserved hypothetical protein [Dinoroseobacter shibae DFL 12 = DSM 16493]URF45469.1 META domain-containing protein [Dinoroseobacter shibae]URF49774.1 META domain-containing protein [Dinoroseobacter shibae]